MKKYLVAILLAFSSISTIYADKNEEISAWDIYIVPKTGLTMSNITTLDGDYRLGPYLGTGIQVYFSPKWSCEVEVSYSKASTKDAFLKNTQSDLSGPYKFNFDMINTTYMMRYHPTSDFSFYVGVNAGRIINEKAIFEGQKRNMKDDLYHAMIAAPIGVSYEMGDFVLDARCSYQINKLADSKAANRLMHKARIFMTQLTLGYKFRMF